MFVLSTFVLASSSVIFEMVLKPKLLLSLTLSPHFIITKTLSEFETLQRRRNNGTGSHYFDSFVDVFAMSIGKIGHRSF